MKRSRHGDYVTGDVSKTGDTSSLYCRFSAVIKMLIALHEQGFQLWFTEICEYLLYTNGHASASPTVFLTLMPVSCKRYRFG